jgi:hypothetical protein
LNVDTAAETELARAWDIIHKIRAKAAAKPSTPGATIFRSSRKKETEYAEDQRADHSSLLDLMRHPRSTMRREIFTT